MTATAQQVLNVARSQLGVVEGKGNRTEYGKWYGMDGQPWCAMFISWCADQVGALDIIPKHAYTPSGAAWFQARGRYGSTPKVGAIVYFRWPSMGRIAHVGIVEEVRADGSVVCIEGNTDEAGGRTGGCVMRKVRRANIHGYGYPQYAASLPTPPAPGVPPAPPKPRPDPANRAQSKATQEAVHVTADGRWGPKTDAAVDRVRHALNNQFPAGVRATQQTVGTSQDGKWGRNSKAALVETVADLQRAWGCKADGKWGPQTEAAWKAARARNYNR